MGIKDGWPELLGHNSEPSSVEEKNARGKQYIQSTALSHYTGKFQIRRFIFQERMRQYIRNRYIDTDNPVLPLNNMQHYWTCIQDTSRLALGGFYVPLPLSVLQFFLLLRHIPL
jgi:hypothetical protein